MARRFGKQWFVLRGCRLMVVFRHERDRVRYTIDLSNWSAPDRLIVNKKDWTARETERAHELRAVAQDVIYSRIRLLTATQPLGVA